MHASVNWTQLQKESVSLKYAKNISQPERQRDKKKNGDTKYPRNVE